MQSRSPVPERVSLYLLDDHALMRRGMISFFDEVGEFDVVGESGSAQEAIRRVPALRPHVALLDVRLPDGSGIEVCRKVRELDPTIHAVMITSFDDDEARLAATLAGAAGFVLKDIQPDVLCATIRRVANGESLISLEERDTVVTNAGRRPLDRRLGALTGQEERVLALLGEGLTNKQIGDRIGLTERTVKNYVSTILRKLGLERRAQAGILAAKDI